MKLNTQRRAEAGLTLIEVLIVVLIIGILSAIAAPGWDSFLGRQQLNAAQNQAHQVIRQAQRQAMVQRSPWQASFRQTGDGVEWAVHAIATSPEAALWQPLSDDVEIDAGETTLLQSSDVYRVQFSPRGNVNGRLGRLTFARPNRDRAKRCVVVSTLLGTLRDAQNRPTPDASGRYCY